MYFDTTEKVIDRRLSLNTWNYGLCVAILGSSGVVANWSVTGGGLRLIILVAISLVAGMGCLLCWFWIRQLRDLKLLNHAKFSVLNEMAPKIRFPGGECSYEPFRREWDILGRQGATIVKRRWKVAVLRSSSAEFLLPHAFMTIFSFVFIITGAVILFNARSLLKDVLVIAVVNTQAGSK